MAGERNVLAVKAVKSKKHFKSSFHLSGHRIVYYLGQVTYLITLISIYKQKSSHPTDVTEESSNNFAVKHREGLLLLSMLRIKQPTSVCSGCWRMTLKVQLSLLSCIFLDNQNKSAMVLS